MDIFCKQLRKFYKQKLVLSIDDLLIPSGSLFGVIGPNGSGKSTLLQIIAGLNPAQGQVRYDGSALNKALQKQVTLVFQRPYLMVGSVLENIIYPLRLRKVERKQAVQTAQAIMEPLGLAPLANQKARTLSGGEAQKMALARALVFQPAVLLLDEPTANVDPVSMREMEAAIVAANKKGTTVVLITHNVAQAARLCSDVAFLYQGKLHETGKTKDVIYHPQKPETVLFIKESTI